MQDITGVRGKERPGGHRGDGSDDAPDEGWPARRHRAAGRHEGKEDGGDRPHVGHDPRLGAGGDSGRRGGAVWGGLGVGPSDDPAGGVREGGDRGNTRVASRELGDAGRHDLRGGIEGQTQRNLLDPHEKHVQNRAAADERRHHSHGQLDGDDRGRPDDRCGDIGWARQGHWFLRGLSPIRGCRL